MPPRCITRGKELLSNRFSLHQRAGAEFGDTAIFIHNGRGPEERKNMLGFLFSINVKISITVIRPQQALASK